MAIIRTIKLNTNDGEQVFPVRELEFYNLVCELEGAGIDIMAITSGSLDRSKLFTTMRAILAVMINVPQEEAGRLIGEHLANDGAFDDIFNVFTQAMTDAGFGNRPQTQDHQKPQRAKKNTTKKPEK